MRGSVFTSCFPLFGCVVLSLCLDICWFYVHCWSSWEILKCKITEHVSAITLIVLNVNGFSSNIDIIKNKCNSLDKYNHV